MPCFTGVDTPAYGRLVLEDMLALERDPPATEGTVARVVFDRDARRQQFKFLDERAVGLEFEFGQLFFEPFVSNGCFREGIVAREDVHARKRSGNSCLLCDVVGPYQGR